jgi:uncharacterized protein YtpQ (UPF0354 family)
MRVRTFLVLALTAVLAASLTACDSGGSSSGTTTAAGTSATLAPTDSGGTTSGASTLTERDFKNKVAAAVITGTDFQADPGFGLAVDVSEQQGLDTVQLVLDDAYKQYTSDPDRQDEIVDGLVRQVVRQMREGNAKRSFSEVRNQLMPMLKRRVDVSRIKDGPAVRPFDDLDVIYAVQGDHYFTVATKDDLDRWGKSVDEIDSLALANLEKQTNKQQKLLCEKAKSQRLCGWASGDGYDATRMLVPGLRRQIVKELGGPAVYAVPLESVFVALTRNYADVIKPKVLQQFTTGDNPLSPELFEERNGQLVAVSP